VTRRCAAVGATFSAPTGGYSRGPLLQAAVDAAAAAGRIVRAVAFHVLRRVQGAEGEVPSRRSTTPSLREGAPNPKVVTASFPFGDYWNSYGAIDPAGRRRRSTRPRLPVVVDRAAPGARVDRRPRQDISRR
jgi:hypothetical protein